MPTKVDLLDHGYVELVDVWGSDEDIVRAARMSTNKGFQGWEKDEKLLAYLYNHKHMTPFEMAGMIIEVQAPIFVFREWMRHRSMSYNELSARYTPLPDINYIPSIDRLMINAGGGNKQAWTIKDAKELTETNARAFQVALAEKYRDCEFLYREALADGVPKELARVCIPVGRYSRMRASANLRNWLAFLTLRMDENAQLEIRLYAEAAANMLRGSFPKTMRLFDDSRN